MRDWIVMTSSASMPAKVKSPYRNVAVVEVDDRGVVPKMISERAKGVRRIVWHSGPQSVGKTERCAYRMALAAAQAMAERLRCEHEGMIAHMQARLNGAGPALTDADMSLLD